ncbi:ANTAR domain-containing protein [Mycobacterium sp. MYCO198283]|uniref:ANTAR domain-containing protein n=1 Tax=Mycobacterium sp. MYCO198283 TaxID=2883505 RepID=UPI001E60C639|nr:ANTAR domain-containing protein [Mycobacterium sp. MYCO198283]MCG5432512.1 ANTAR domain-containing protein [Mycobacterium sp. MYCO198283]
MIFSTQQPIGSRRVIDIAVGILIGRRGCTPQQAFEEIAGAVRTTGSSLGQVTAALVAYASDASDGGDIARLWADRLEAPAALRPVG